MEHPTNILIVDADQTLAKALEQMLSDQGHHVEKLCTGKAAFESLARKTPELVILDLQLPDTDGWHVFEQVSDLGDACPVVVVTGRELSEQAVTTLLNGPGDYLRKPISAEELAAVVQRTLENIRLRKELACLRSQKGGCYDQPSIVACSREMGQVLEMVDKIASSDAATVFIQGESGTGKELVARAIHYQSARASQPFMAINCAAVPQTLLESELMGHEKGAFTDAKNVKKGLFELADGGTVFLDEIGDMDPAMQAKLLRVLEERTFRRVGGTRDIKVDVRIVSATNRDLHKAMEDKSFRPDLYYRIGVIPVQIPPLRERRDDILPLAEFFIRQFNREFNKKVRGISRMAQKILLEYSWPGNIRELRNVIERSVILECEEQLLVENLPRELVAQSVGDNIGPLNFQLPPEGVDIEDIERELIRQALEMAQGNQTQAAKLLRLGIDAFRYRMKKFGFM
ncbi:sigma-54-dependent transcriptional response regulator [Syntrophotalea carbinolica DSM 2380]|uniref:Sigma-54-dependent transcriptional response regulator n=1 Tax=Syntrophotalea carbinolica (strain DSM 2380 / NBRC 103641 / GraBd1) TaxID=338963 RepID=Q3A103_SYNC1|nr:sigma-54 dependent transcriptional regulator [Syntrophotalea carbinolica]ABA89954.2 sigma-54-dependent transcriptional response regulator [Syntrophotalea carbinolica DSM 2380]